MVIWKTSQKRWNGRPLRLLTRQAPRSRQQQGRAGSRFEELTQIALPRRRRGSPSHRSAVHLVLRIVSLAVGTMAE